MTNRSGLQQKLEAILGSRHVYYQPPENLKIDYPAIIYSLNIVKDRKADNNTYNTHWQYEIILVDKQPDSQYVEKILEIPTCRYGRSYVSDNLNHYLFYVYY